MNGATGMIAEILQSCTVACYIKFYSDYTFYMYVVCFIIYLYIYMYIIYFFNFAIYFYFHII